MTIIKTIKYIGREGKDAHHAVWVEAEQCLGQKFAGDEHDERAQQCLDQDAEPFVGACTVGHVNAQGDEQRLVDELSHQYSIDDQADVVAHKQRGDEVVGMGIEGVDKAR